MSDEHYLIAHAERVAKRDICRHLKRSSKSVERKAAHLREQGHAITLRHYTPRLDTCPSCGCLSGHMGKEGICEPCRRREQLATIHARIAELLPLLPQAERDTYEKTEAETASRYDRMPKAPSSAATYYEQQRDKERHALAMEAWSSANLKREIKAAQKRKERIEKKVKTNGGLYISPDER